MDSDLIRGSQWRKWDLHVHTPNTKCNDNYESTEVYKWDLFCDEIEKSDVEAIGITDYFSADNFFIFKKKFEIRFPNSKKVFFPNIELRLNESVNPVQEEINIHLILRPDIKEKEINELLNNLKTEKTNATNKKLKCSELKMQDGQNDYESATVTRESIAEAVKETFGDKAVRQDHLLIIAAANNDGIRPERGKQRKEIITDEIDKFCDGFFGGSQNSDHFFDKDRLEDKGAQIKEKPVFSGSDAHSFDDLNKWLGKTVSDDQNNKEITWIKADPTYEGLLQTLIEPRDRVKVVAVRPDDKDGYKVIDKITFNGTSDFPQEIVFNSNLSSIIGSRSSGKSALLNYIAHAINRDDAEAKLPEGPAANKSWNDVNFSHSIYWNDGSENSTGKAIFLPQNYLYDLSSKPREITEKIKPVLFNKYPDIEAIYSASNNAISSSNDAIEGSVKRWFELRKLISIAKETMKNIGEKSVLENAKQEYQTKIDTIKESLSLTDMDVASYQAVSLKISQLEVKGENINREISSLMAQFYGKDSKSEVVDLEVDINVNPSIKNLPSSLDNRLQAILSRNKSNFIKEIKDEIKSYVESQSKELNDLKTKVDGIKADNKELIERNKRNEELSKVIDEYNKQNELLEKIIIEEEKIKSLDEKVLAEIKIIEENLTTRTEVLKALQDKINGLDQKANAISFCIEVNFNEAELLQVSDKFNLKETKNNPYIEEDKVEILKIRKELSNFLQSLSDDIIRLKINHNYQDVAISVLTFTEEIRFSATMEDDKIGGFSPSSMTPGKQALFALTLILDESNDSWPLLIDQPEDDLDSRSIYKYIANYLKQKKKERQIIMVSHNANLVLGADSEQLIIANKHGDDRKNRGNQMFSYLSGSLENTCPRNSSQYVLETCGIREHACDILDGGEEAFEKRRNKYKI